MTDIDHLFENQSYLSIESYRKSGEAVRTPVWFAQEGSTFYIWTKADSWKVKRIRRNPQVRIAPSDQRGKPLGDYVDGTAAMHAPGTPDYQHAEKLMNKKYGILKKIFGLFSSKSKRMVIAVQTD